MIRYILKEKGKLDHLEELSKIPETGKVLVRLTKVGITSSDIAIYRGIRNTVFPIVPTSLAVGVVSETGNDVFSCKKGDRVLLVPYSECERCFQCKTENEKECQNYRTRGISENGFLSDFVEIPENKVIVLPKRISDESALFVKYIDIAIKICDLLDIKKGQNILIGNAGVLGIIVGQVVKYNQATPIFAERNLQNLKVCSTFEFPYVYSSQKEDFEMVIKQITGGKMADAFVSISEYSFETEKAPKFVAKGGKIIVHRENSISSSIDVDLLYERNISIFPVKSSGQEYMMALNFLVNDIIDTKTLHKEAGNFSDSIEIFENLSNSFEQKESIMVRIIDMLR